MTYLLDTDHLSILQWQTGREFDALAARIARHGQAQVGLSIVSFHEQAIGCHTYITRARDSAGVTRGYNLLSKVIRTFHVAPVLPFDESAAAVFDQLTAKRLRVGTMDLRIASIALAHHLTLVTRNTVDFSRVPGLRVEDWTI